MFELTCRARAAGREFAAIAPVPGTPDPAEHGPETWVLFVHGFNNAFDKTRAKWRKTVRELQERSVRVDNLVLFYWPGDYSETEIQSAINYPLTVPDAEDTAVRLADYLEGVFAARGRPMEVAWVAHSLGSLVVLETCRLLRERERERGGSGVVVREMLLMAAAVPEGFCVEGEVYGERHGVASRETVLYSLDDSVLKNAFQLGQAIADRFPDERQRAVGRSGGPGSGDGERWSRAKSMDGFEHGDYWGRPESVEQIARVVDQRILRGIRNEELRIEVARAARVDDGGFGDVDEIPPEIIIPWLARMSE